LKKKGSWGNREEKRGGSGRGWFEDGSYALRGGDKEGIQKED